MELEMSVDVLLNKPLPLLKKKHKTQVNGKHTVSICLTILLHISVLFIV